MRQRLISVGVLATGLVAGGAFLYSAQADGVLPPALRVEPRSLSALPLPTAHAAAMRNDAFRRAAVRLSGPSPFALPPLESPTEPASPITCRFLPGRPSGTSPKFDCVLADGQVIKIKYGRNAEVYAEILATRLLRGLGYAADEVTMARRVRCYGCPRYPFLAMQGLALAGAEELMAPHGVGGYTDFEWVSVERKFPAAPIETGQVEGFDWWELKASQAPREDLDAFRLLAVFLAHWDNKASNQRLVCLDAREPSGTPCASPLLMIQDLGSTFGPSKLNVVRWHGLTIWTDRAACRVSMKAFPWRGGSFPDATISEPGRLQLAQQLSSITDEHLERLFVDAHVPAYLSGSDDASDVALWKTAFRARANQIVDGGPCPSLPGDGPGVD